MVLEFIRKPLSNKRTGQFSFTIPKKKLTNKEKKKLLDKEDVKIIVEFLK